MVTLDDFFDLTDDVKAFLVAFHGCSFGLFLQFFNVFCQLTLLSLTVCLILDILIKERIQFLQVFTHLTQWVFATIEKKGCTFQDTIVIHFLVDVLQVAFISFVQLYCPAEQRNLAKSVKIIEIQIYLTLCCQYLPNQPELWKRVNGIALHCLKQSLQLLNLWKVIHFSTSRTQGMNDSTFALLTHKAIPQLSIANQVHRTLKKKSRIDNFMHIDVDFLHCCLILYVISAPFLSPNEGFIRSWQELKKGKDSNNRKFWSGLVIKKSDYLVMQIQAYECEFHRIIIVKVLQSYSLKTSEIPFNLFQESVYEPIAFKIMPKLKKSQQSSEIKGVFLNILFIVIEILFNCCFNLLFGNVFFEKNTIVQSDNHSKISNKLIVYNVINKKLSKAFIKNTLLCKELKHYTLQYLCPCDVLYRLTLWLGKRFVLKQSFPHFFIDVAFTIDHKSQKQTGRMPYDLSYSMIL